MIHLVHPFKKRTFAPYFKNMTQTQSSAANGTAFDLFARLENTDHEQVVYCQDRATGLKAIIAIHNTVLGPGLGGTRMWKYSTEAEALNDVLRRSRGMTYKASIAGLNLGGAKAVISGDAAKDKSEALMRKFGRFVENLNGKYITAEDVGTTTRDMEYVNMESDHVVGLPESMGGGGDPSPVTAYGVYMGMKASAKAAFGNDSLAGKTIAVQGIGKVGMHLVEYLHKEGARLFVSDIHDAALQHAASHFGATVVNGGEIYGLDADIFAPCALGAILNTENIGKLKVKVVAGAANNQLEDETVHGDMLRSKGIVYAPDFVINAGGLINVYSEYTGYVREIAMAQTENIYNTTLEIFDYAQKNNLTPQKAAMAIAESRIEQRRKENAK